MDFKTKKSIVCFIRDSLEYMNMSEVLSPVRSKMSLTTDSNSTLHTLQNSYSDLKYKTEICKNWEQTFSCKYGSKCKFAHGKEEL